MRAVATIDYIVAVRRVGTPDEFVAAPTGRYFAGRTLLVWCFAPDLRGSVYWGNPDENDVRQLVRALDLDLQSDLAFDVVTDGRRLESVAPAVFDQLASYIARRMPGYRARFRRHAIVHPPSVLGTVMTGFYPMLGAHHRLRPFTDPARAFAWLGRPDAARARAEVEALVDRLRGVPKLVQSVRDLLGDKGGTTSVAAAARGLGLSTRSLQRQLQAAGTSFRAEVERDRVAVAQRLLASSDAKLEVIAHRLGYASRAHFSTLFKRASGETPGSYRTRVRKS